MKKLFFYFSIILFLTINTYSQDVNPKWGKVTKEELLLEQCSFDTTADAMVLSKTGELKFIYNIDKGWQYRIDIVKRIKIFSTKGKSEGSISLTVYDPISGSSKEVISSLKGVTFNVVNDKIEKTKLENDMLFETRLNDYRTEVSFAMPNVKEGSVIEYKFTLISDYISNLYEWHFQEEIPVGYVSYNYTIPEFFIYNNSIVGNVIPLQKKDDNKNETFTYEYLDTPAGQAPVKRKATINSLSKFSAVSATNISPILEEPMMNNKSNLSSRLESQLIAIEMPGQPYKMVATTYDAFSKTILEWSSFGKQLSKAGFAKEKIASIDPNADAAHKINVLYQWIRDQTAFNNVYGFSSNDANKKLIQSGEGSVADINLTLVAVMREAGLDAHPILLSTRGHGIPHPVYPSYEEFNYVIAGIILNDNIILADATSNLPLGMLPTRCLNGKGWMVREIGSQWIDMKSGYNEIYSVQTDLTLSENMLKKNTSVKFDDYALYGERGKYLEDKEKYRQKIANSYNDSEPKIEVDDEDGLRLNIESIHQFDADILYLTPFEYGAVMENPFKRSERFSNVDFPYGSSIKVIANLEVPEGYTVEIPENTAIGLPGNGGKFIYSTQRNGNRVTIFSQFELSQTVFSSDEYPILKQFYQLMADKNTEPIVIKKR